MFGFRRLTEAEKAERDKTIKEMAAHLEDAFQKAAAESKSRNRLGCVGIGAIMASAMATLCVCLMCDLVLTTSFDADLNRQLSHHVAFGPFVFPAYKTETISIEEELRLFTMPDRFKSDYENKLDLEQSAQRIRASIELHKLIEEIRDANKSVPKVRRDVS